MGQQLVYSKSLDKYIVVNPGQTVEQAVAEAGAHPTTPVLGPLGGPSGDASELSQMDPIDFMKTSADIGLNAAQFGVGLIPGASLPMIAGRIATEGALGAAEGALDGNPLGGAVEEATKQGLGEGIGMTAPWLGNAAAMAIGNGFQRLKGGFTDAVNAFTRQGQRQEGRIFSSVAEGKSPFRMPVGSGRVEPAKKAMGQKIADAELANPEKAPLSDLAGSNRDYFDDSLHSEFPNTNRKDILSDEAKFLREQIIERNRDKYVQIGQQLGLKTNDPTVVYDMLQGSKIGKLINQRLAAKTQLSVRDLGELKRDIAHQPSVGQLRSAQKQGNMVPEGAMQRAQMGQNRAGKVNEVRLDLNAQRPLGSPDLVPLDAEFGDLAKMAAANDALRSGGKTFGDLSMFGIRGATGFMLGRALGLDGEMSSLLGAASLLGLSPVNVSRGGNIAGKVGHALPNLSRAIEIEQDLERTKTRRRKPSQETKK